MRTLRHIGTKLKNGFREGTKAVSAKAVAAKAGKK